MKKLIFILIILLSIKAEAKFFSAPPDTVKISSQDSVGVYDSTMIFAVQKKVTGTYRWRKMYTYQLKNILLPYFPSILGLSNTFTGTNQFNKKMSFGTHGAFILPSLDTAVVGNLFSDGSRIMFRKTGSVKDTLADIAYVKAHAGGFDSTKGYTISGKYRFTKPVTFNDTVSFYKPWIKLNGKDVQWLPKNGYVFQWDSTNNRFQWANPASATVDTLKFATHYWTLAQTHTFSAVNTFTNSIYVNGTTGTGIHFGASAFLTLPSVSDGTTGDIWYSGSRINFYNGANTQVMNLSDTPSVVVPYNRKITINGVTHNLSANASWTVSGVVDTTVYALKSYVDTYKASKPFSQNASNLTSGTVATARLGSGSASSSTFLRGDNTWAVPTATADQSANYTWTGTHAFRSGLGVGYNAGSIVGSVTFQNGNASLPNNIYLTSKMANHATGWLYLPGVVNDTLATQGYVGSNFVGIVGGKSVPFDTSITHWRTAYARTNSMFSLSGNNTITGSLYVNGINNRIYFGTLGQFTLPVSNNGNVGDIWYGTNRIHFTNNSNTYDVANIQDTSSTLATQAYARVHGGSGTVDTSVYAQKAFVLKNYTTYAYAKNASNLSSGTVAVARLGSGTPSSSNFLRGDGSWQTVTATIDTSIYATKSLVTKNYANLLNNNTFSNFQIFQSGLGVGYSAGAMVGVITFQNGNPYLPNNIYLSSKRANHATGYLYLPGAVNDTLSTQTFSSNANNLTIGTVGTARLGSGTANSSTFLRGDGTWSAPTVSIDSTIYAKRTWVTTATKTFSGTNTFTDSLYLGSTSKDGSLRFNNATNSKVTNLLVTAPANDITINLPTQGGTLALASTTLSGYGITDGVSLSSANAYTGNNNYQYGFGLQSELAVDYVDLDHTQSIIGKNALYLTSANDTDLTLTDGYNGQMLFVTNHGSSNIRLFNCFGQPILAAGKSVYIRYRYSTSTWYATGQ